MMTPDSHRHHIQAQDDLRLAGQWLALLRFRANSALPAFSPLISSYHELLDPSAENAQRLRVAIAMHAHVRRQVEIENFRGEEIHARNRPPDPYALVWQTTERGAALFMIERLLSEAIAGLEEGETAAG